MKPKIAILIPCYNEENTIPQIISELRKLQYPYLIVDDGSTDMTNKLLVINKAIFITYYPNKGKGYAIKYGAKKLISGGYDYILIMDADGQHDMRDINSFISTLEIYPTTKIIIGNRLWNPKGMSLIRKLTNKFMSWTVSRLTGGKIFDTQCGMRLIHKDVITKLKIKSNNFDYESEQLIKAGRNGYQIRSIPIECIYKKERESKINSLRDTIRFFRMIKKFI